MELPRLILLATLALAALPAMAALNPEPCTLYNADQIATARRNLEQHEWARKLLEGYRRQVSFAMGLEREELEAFVPELTPWPTYGQSCPVCVGKQSSMGETGLWQWSTVKPDDLTCKYCKTTFPHPDYPETGVMEATRMGQRFTYYLTDAERANPDDLSGKHAFRWASWPVHTSWTGMVRERKASWAAVQVPVLAKIYALTGEVEYAERCVWLLDALARAYPNWLYHSYNGVFADLPPGEAAAEMGRNPRAGRFPKGTIVTAFPHLADPDGDGFEQLNNGFWGAGRLEAGIGGEGVALLNFTAAYDLVRDAAGADGQPLLTPEMRQRIENDLILAGCDDLENYDSIDNKCGPARALSAAVARLFGHPTRARRALEGWQRLLDEDFHFDGFCAESPSYSAMHLGLMQEIPDILDGYSDPAGYQPAEGGRFDDFDPYQRIPRYRLALESMVRMLRPDRKYPVLGDTHSGGGLSSLWAEVLAARYGPEYAGLLEIAQGAPLAERGSEYALWNRDPDLAAPGEADLAAGEADLGGGEAELPLRSEWFPGWQVGVLRLGGPESDTAFYFNGYAYHGHRHHDTLGIIYHDHGRELASDRGYIWDDPRNAWTRSTLSHNLVTVDDADQVAKGRHSTLHLFGTGPNVEVVEASANAYPQCETYARTSALVGAGEQQTYALDVFRVKGGGRHQYGFQCNGTLAGVEGVDPQPADDEHKWLSNFRAATPAGPWRATWTDEGVNTQLIALTPGERMVLTDAPGWRSYKGDQLNAPPIQQVFAENRGDDLDSLFVTLMVPYTGDASPVLDAELLLPAGGALTSDQPVAVRVEFADHVDYLYVSPDTTERTFGPVTAAARFAHVRVDPAGEVLDAWMLAGTRLACGAHELTAPAPTTPVIVASVAGTTMSLAEPLPAGRVQPGDYLLVNGTGYEIAAADGTTIEVRDYPLQTAEAGEVVHRVGSRP